MQILVEVTEDHIENGTPDDCETCMVALAIKPYLKRNQDFCIDGTHLLLTTENKDNPKLIPLPVEVQFFINKFDSGKRISPFTFKLDIPKKFLTRSKKIF